jgi:hypothetical protein
LANRHKQTLTIYHMRDCAIVVCPNCTPPIDDTRYSETRHSCPFCGAPSRAEEPTRWIDLARVTNLAEAGFLTDELVGHGVDAQIHQLEEFSALTDRWSSLYLIRVPAPAAQTAAAHIRQHLADEPAEAEFEAATFRFADGNQQLEPQLWRPFALVILAGVSSFVLGQRFSDRPDPPAERRPPRNSLTSAMEAIDRPFVIDPAPGMAGHRLQFDRRRQTWTLDTDRDGDGSYDSTHVFQAVGTTW